MNLTAAVPLALAGAGSFAISAVLQQRAASKAPANESLSWRLIADLLRRRMWVMGMSCVLVGFALQATALSFAPVAVVEPLIATELVVALPIAARTRRSRLGTREWVGATAVSAGVALFLGVSSPRGGDPEPGLWTWVATSLPVLAAAACAVAFAGRKQSPRRAVLLATAAGLCFALLALVLQSLVALFAEGAEVALTSWQPYALTFLGPVAFTIAQSAYQAAPLAVSLPIIDSIEPAGAVVLSALAFRQSLSFSPLSLALECAAALAALSGIFLLGRSPLVLGIYESQRATKNTTCSGMSGAEAVLS